MWTQTNQSTGSVQYQEHGCAQINNVVVVELSRCGRQQAFILESILSSCGVKRIVCMLCSRHLSREVMYIE